MALGNFRPGVYGMTYNGQAVGMCTSGGKNLRKRRKARPINDSDSYGFSTIDGINMGHDWFLTCTFKEWNAGVRQAIDPYSATPFDSELRHIGWLDSDHAKVIVLTAQTGSPAAVLGPATLTASYAILAEENDVNVIFGPDETDVPVVFKLLPYDVGAGVIKNFVLT